MQGAKRHVYYGNGCNAFGGAPGCSGQELLVTLYLPLESLVSETTVAELQEIFGKDVMRLSHNEIIILSMALSEGEISNISLQNSVDLHPSDLSKLLRKMRDDCI